MNAEEKALAEIFSRYSMGTIELKNLRDLIVSIVSEESSQQMLAVAICDETDEDCIKRTARTLFLSLGFDKIGWLNTLRVYAVVISKMILSGTISEELGAGLISDAVTLRCLETEFHELDTFRYAWSELSNRPKEAKMFVKVIREEAEGWASRNISEFMHDRLIRS